VNRLGALEALGRGIANVRGNLETAGVAAAGTLVLTGVVLLALVPWLGLDGDGLSSLFRLTAGHGQPADLAALGRQSWALMSNLWGFVLALSLATTVAFFAYCWYFAGILGVLYAGDAQAPPGPGRAPELFRTWSFRFFAGEASRLGWRLVWFYSLWSLILFAVTTLFVAGVVVAAALAGDAGGVAALAVGCGVLLPFLFAVFVMIGAMSLGQADLVAPESGVLAATRTGMRLTGRRLPAVAALFVLFFVVALAVGLLEAGVGVLVGRVLVGSPAAAVAAQLVLFVAQVLLSALLNLALAGACVALVRSERRRETEAVA